MGGGWWPEREGGDRNDEHGNREGRDRGDPGKPGPGAGPVDDGRGHDSERDADDLFLPDEPGPDPEQSGSGREGAESGSGKKEPSRGLASAGLKTASRYSIYVGVIFIGLILVAVINAIGTDGSGLLGAEAEAERGRAMPAFAVPDIRGDIDADGNLAPDDCASDRNPCPADDQRKPACGITVDGAIRVCDLFDKPVAISFWFTRGGNCIESQDAFDAVASGPLADRVNFLSVNIRDDRSLVEDLVSERGWTVPVGHDADGVVSNAYLIGVCPTIALGYPGGIFHAAEIKPGNFDEGEIEEMVEGLLSASAERERGRNDG